MATKESVAENRSDSMEGENLFEKELISSVHSKLRPARRTGGLCEFCEPQSLSTTLECGITSPSRCVFRL